MKARQRARLMGAGVALACLLCMVVGYAMLGQRPWTLDVAGARLSLLDPRGLAVAALTPLVWFAALRSLSDLPLAQRLGGALMRSLLLWMLGLAMSQPVSVESSSAISAVLLVDVSDSISDAGLAEARAHLEHLYGEKGKHDLQVVTFAGDARRAPKGATSVPEIQRHDEDSDATDLSAALRLAQGLFVPGRLQRALVLSDGVETRGHALAEAKRASAHGTRIYVTPLTSTPPAEVGFVALDAPSSVRVGTPFELHAEVFSTRATSATLRASQGDVPNGLDPTQELDLAVGRTHVRVRSVAHVAGPLRYRLDLAPHGDDRFEANNHYEHTIDVRGSPRVLIVDSEPARVGALARALGAAGFDLDVRGSGGLPQNEREFASFDFCILSDVPSEDVSERAMHALEGYVRKGGGFLMAGGERSFGLGGYRGTAMEKLLPVRMEAERRKDQPSLAMALVIDKSGSMEGRKIQLAKEAARATAELLGPDDYIGVIGFDARAQRLVRMQSANNRIGVSRDIGRLTAGGGTSLFPALDAAYEDLAATRARVKHVILLTDGQTQEVGLPLLVSNMRADGITVSTIGLGADVHRGLLTDLARRGGGRSYFTTEPHNIPRLFVRETHEVARSAAVEQFVDARAVAGAGFLSGVPLQSAPPLRGYVATRMKPAPARAVLASDLGEPLLARWRVGLGWALAWTSDLKARWSVDWLRWPGFSRLMGQLVHEHMRPRPESELPLTATLDGDEAEVVVDALSQEDRFLNGLAAELTVTGSTRSTSGAGPAPGPDGAVSANLPLRMPVPQQAPGRYAVTLPLTGFGSFALDVTLRRNGRTVAKASGTLTRPFPAEYKGLGVDEKALEQLASAGGGSVLTSEITDLFASDHETVEAYVARWPTCVWISLVLFVLDLALRRVRLR